MLTLRNPFKTNSHMSQALILSYIEYILLTYNLILISIFYICTYTIDIFYFLFQVLNKPKRKPYFLNIFRTYKLDESFLSLNSKILSKTCIILRCFAKPVLFLIYPILFFSNTVYIFILHFFGICRENCFHCMIFVLTIAGAHDGPSWVRFWMRPHIIFMKV